MSFRKSLDPFLLHFLVRRVQIRIGSSTHSHRWHVIIPNKRAKIISVDIHQNQDGGSGMLL